MLLNRGCSGFCGQRALRVSAHVDAFLVDSSGPNGGPLYDLPKSLSDAKARVSAFVGLLKLLFGEDTIATQGYVEGLRIMETRGRVLIDEGNKDPIFFTRFLHMLDTFFQKFCNQLLLSYARNPLEPFRGLPRDYMKLRVCEAVAKSIDSVYEAKLELPVELHALATLSAPDRASQSGQPREVEGPDE